MPIDGRRPILLDRIDHGHEITDVDVCGIATDHCVRATTLDAVREGFKARVLTDLIWPMEPSQSASKAGAESSARRLLSRF